MSCKDIKWKDKNWEIANQLFVMDRSPYITVYRPQPGIPTLPDIVECTITFTNTSYPDLPVSLPESITDISGAVIVLPTVTGEYEDALNYYTPSSWSIGAFGDTITFYQDSITANLLFEVTPKAGDTYTVSFKNTAYPQFPVTLPNTMIVASGSSIILPQVSGEYEDELNYYTPLSWSIGNFGASITVEEDIEADLVWNVQPKIITYTLSFTNTIHPEFVIELPESIRAEVGTAIILPSMSGEYEDDNYTYTPESWDIGAFGNSITLNGNVSANLLWHAESKVPSYEEITLYLDSATKLMQAGITSSSTGNVEANTCYTLYTNEELTTPWTGFDYSHDYELGYYTNGGEWIRTPIQSVGEMPDTTVPVTSNAKNGRTIVDTNKLWLYTNYAYSGVYKINVSRITVRIYPKDQQYYAFYAGNSTYNNIGITNGNIGGLKGVPRTSANTVPWGVSDASLPTRTIYKILGSVGNEISQSGVGWRDPSLGFNYYQLANNSGAKIELRTVVFSLSVPTFYAYAPSDEDVEMPFTQSVYLVDIAGNRIPTQAGETYVLIGLFRMNGDASTNTWSHIYGASKRVTLSSYNGYLYLSYSSLVGSIYFHKVWYIKQ